MVGGVKGKAISLTAFTAWKPLTFKSYFLLTPKLKAQSVNTVLSSASIWIHLWSTAHESSMLNLTRAHNITKDWRTIICSTSVSCYPTVLAHCQHFRKRLLLQRLQLLNFVSCPTISASPLTASLRTSNKSFSPTHSGIARAIWLRAWSSVKLPVTRVAALVSANSSIRLRKILSVSS